MNDFHDRRYFGGCWYDHQNGVLYDSHQQAVNLRIQSIQVLQRLLAEPGAVVSKRTLFEEVWQARIVTDDSLVQCIADIRRAIGDNERSIIQTVPKRGYRLQLDVITSEPSPTKHSRIFTVTQGFSTMSLAAKSFLFAGLLSILSWALFFPDSVTEGPVAAQQSSTAAETEAKDDGRTALSIEIGNHAQTKSADAVLAAVEVALSDYFSVALVDKNTSEFRLSFRLQEMAVSSWQLHARLLSHSGVQLWAETYLGKSDEDVTWVSRRLAAAVASPGVGAIGRELLARSQSKSAAELSRAECFAHGFGCSKCSGEEDNIFKVTELCLARILEDDPDNARALALQATVFSHQFHFGNTLAEPQRSDLSARQEFPALAVRAANRAEAASVGNDSAVYWGMAEAYFASCDTDKLRIAVQRGLEINPHDPNLLATFGNWLSYSGAWDEGADLTEKAITTEPVHYRKWWWMGPAKRHYFKGEYSQALEGFLKAYNHRNWVSHLQLAYTLPYLRRIDEARIAVESLQRLNPGYTREHALEFYKSLCFPTDFLNRMDKALVLAGLQSRGSHNSDYSIISPPRAQTINIADHTVEYLSVGQGETVLFVHGAMSDYRTWGDYMLPISANHRFVTYSRRYFGTQAWPDDAEHFDVQSYSDELIALIEALDTGPVHLVTWSSGAGPVARASIDRPDLVKSAIYFEPVNYRGPENKALNLARADLFGSEVFAQAIEASNLGHWELAAQHYLETVFEEPTGFFENERATLREVNRQNALTVPHTWAGFAAEGQLLISCEELGEVGVPSVMVVGAESHRYFSLLTTLFGRCIRESTYVEIPGTNHRGPIDPLAVDDFVAVILDTVEKHQ